jgi:hypothetical protein
MTTPLGFTPGEELPDNVKVRRAARKPSWLDMDSDKFVFSAFLRRSGEDGLSVDVVGLRDEEETKHAFNPCHGLATLEVGQIRALGLQVIFVPIDDSPEKRNPAHAVIIGMPSEEEDWDHAHDFAYRLAALSTVTYRRRPAQP